MPLYAYHCPMCGYRFERNATVEHRDLPQACDQCGNGAERQFLPATVLLPWTFNACMISDIAQTYEQAAEQDRRNEQYLANKPKEKPSFEETIKKEFDLRGIRHPERLFDD